MYAGVLDDLRNVFCAPNRKKTEMNLQDIVLNYQISASKLSLWKGKYFPISLTVFLSIACRKKIITTYGIERINWEIVMRTKVVGIILNVNSC
jgi:transposase-like protein